MTMYVFYQDHYGQAHNYECEENEYCAGIYESYSRTEKEVWEALTVKELMERYDIDDIDTMNEHKLHVYEIWDADTVIYRADFINQEGEYTNKEINELDACIAADAYSCLSLEIFRSIEEMESWYENPKGYWLANDLGRYLRKEVWYPERIRDEEEYKEWIKGMGRLGEKKRKQMLQWETDRRFGYAPDDMQLCKYDGGWALYSPETDYTEVENGGSSYIICSDSSEVPAEADYEEAQKKWAVEPLKYLD